MTWTDIWEWPYCAYITDGYVRPQGSGSGSEDRPIVEQGMADYLVKRIRNVGRWARTPPPRHDHVHACIIGSPGWIHSAPGSLRSLADIHQREESDDYRLIILGLDIRSWPDDKAYRGDFGGWVYCAGLRRQKVRPPRAGFLVAGRNFLRPIRAAYVERGELPTAYLATLGVPLAHASD